MRYAHLPQAKFGQLSSCGESLSKILQWVGALLCGGLIGAFAGNNRAAFLYGGICYLLVPIFLILLMRTRNPFAALPTSMQPGRGKRSS